jgi:hypothetical protein
VPSAPETQSAERTRLAWQRSRLAFLLIAALLGTHSHAWLGVSAALLVAAAGLRARTPRGLAATTILAGAAAVVVVTV